VRGAEALRLEEAADPLVVRLQTDAGLAPANVEITLTETPRHNGGLHGMPGDELQLGHTVEV
jgi:hypothetical protein